MTKVKAAISLYRGFTLIEILVAVLIIGILAAVAVPQYQRAVLKSRFAALMPIAKSMADSNEAFYLEHGEYAGNAQDLPVQGRMNYSDGTELKFGTTTSHAYVLATRNNDFPNKYIVYQKHSEEFPGEIHCEADSTNDLAKDVCKSFGATQDIGETLTPGYLTYVLFGTGDGVAPTGDEGGEDESDTGDSGESTEPTTPVRTPESVTCNSTYCKYDFGADGYYLNYPNAGAVLSCKNYGGCEVYGTSLDIYDRTKTLGASAMNVRFDENGNIQWFMVKADNKDFYYDGSGNFLGGQGGIDANGNGCTWGSANANSCYQVYYKPDGTIGQLQKYPATYYDYNANGQNSSAPIKDVTPYYLTSENNAVQLSIVQELLSKPHKKCDLYPELEDCQTANSGN